MKTDLLAAEIETYRLVLTAIHKGANSFDLIYKALGLKTAEQHRTLEQVMQVLHKAGKIELVETGWLVVDNVVPIFRGRR